MMFEQPKPPDPPEPEDEGDEAPEPRPGPSHTRAAEAIGCLDRVGVPGRVPRRSRWRAYHLG